MRNSLAALLLLVGLLSQACTGITARQSALLPTLQTSWRNQKADFLAELEATAQQPGAETRAANIRALEDGLAGGSVAVLSTVNVEMLREIGLSSVARRVQAGTVGKNAAVSYREGVEVLCSGLRTFLARGGD